jgi:hypothetical protein
LRDFFPILRLRSSHAEHTSSGEFSPLCASRLVGGANRGVGGAGLGCGDASGFFKGGGDKSPWEKRRELAALQSGGGSPPFSFQFNFKL